MKGEVMKFKKVATVLIGFSSVVLFGAGMLYFTKDSVAPTAAWHPGMPNDKAIRIEPDADTAHQHTRSIKTTEIAESKNSKVQSVQNEVAAWEQKIHDYITVRALSDVNTSRVPLLAERTTEVFRMLQTASARQKKGMDPYTAYSGFATMTLMLSMEDEFQEVIGVTFSDFMGTLDTAFIERMAKAE